jgi:hypothetical protein
MIEQSTVHLPELLKDIDRPVSIYLVHLSSSRRVRIIISVSFLVGVPQKEAALRREENRSAAIVHPDDDPSRLGVKGSSFAPRILCLLSGYGVRRRRGLRHTRTRRVSARRTSGGCIKLRRGSLLGPGPVADLWHVLQVLAGVGRGPGD